jgi:hypothetical protein
MRRPNATARSEESVMMLNEAAVVGPASAIVPEKARERVALRCAPVVARPLLFDAVVQRRSHDMGALAAALILMCALLIVGVWMTVDIAEAVSLAERCDGKCVVAG